MNIRAFFDRIFFFSLLSPVKASTLDKLIVPKVKMIGNVKNINKGWMNSITLKLEGKDNTFYISRGIERGLNPDSLQLKLLGKQIEISYRELENSNPSQPIPISQIIFNREIIFTEM